VRNAVGLVVILAIAGGTPGCGWDAPPQRKTPSDHGESILAYAPPLRSVQLDDDIRATPPGTPQRALLEYWDALQWGAWSDVIATIAPEARGTMSDEELLDVLRSQWRLFRTTRPAIADVALHGSDASVTWDLAGPDRATTRQTMRMRADNGRWVIVDDPYLRFLRSTAKPLDD
jgi:hypothetical protein